MKLPVNIYVESEQEKRATLQYLEEQGVHWHSGHKPTQWGDCRERFAVGQDRRLGNGSSEEYGRPVRGASLIPSTAEYMVYSPEGPTPPRKTHSTYQYAAQVARTMAEKYPGQTFRVLKVLPGTVKVELNPETTDTLENPDA